MPPNDADEMANSVDPDQIRSSLIWVCTVCSNLSAPILRIFTEDSQIISKVYGHSLFIWWKSVY